MESKTKRKDEGVQFKPLVHQTLMFCVDGHTYLVPNCAWAFSEKECTVYSKPLVGIIKEKKASKIIIDITTDPLAQHAGDWTDLGNFRLRTQFYDCKLKKEKQGVVFSFKEKDIHYLIPER